MAEPSAHDPAVRPEAGGTTTRTVPHPRARRRRVARAVLGVLGALVLALLACEALEWPFLRGPLERQLSSALHREVQISGNFGVRLFGSVRAHADEVIMGSGRGVPALLDADGQPRDFMHARHLRLALSYRTLWQQWRGTGQPLQVRLLDVDGLELNLRRNADGRANWQLGAAAPASAASVPRLPTFERLDVRDGQVRLLDEPLQITAEAQVTTNEGSAAADAQAGPPGLTVQGKGTYKREPLVLQFHSSGVLPLASSAADTPPVPVWMEVRAGKSQLRVEGRASDLLHFGGLDAAFHGSGPSLAAVGDAIGVTLPTTASFTTQGRVAKHGTQWEARVASLDIGSSRLRGDFRFDSGLAVPKLTGTLGGTRLALADLGPAFGGATPEQPAKVTPGHVLPEREFDIPSLRAMNAEVGVALDTAELGSQALEPFQPLRAHISLEGGVLRLQELLARTSQGLVAGSIGLDSRPPTPRWDAQLRWSGIRLERFVRKHDVAARGNDAMPASQGGYVSGALGGNAQLRGAGRSTAALMASLDGSVRMWVRDGTISHLLLEATGIDIAQALGVYLKGDDAMPMRCALASFLVAKGKLMPEVGVIDTHDTTLFVGGEVSLGDETLGLKVTAQPHDISVAALRSPIDIDGSFASPHVHLEARPLERRAGLAAALAAVNPLASLLALVDWRKPEKDVCTTAVAHVAGAAQAGVRASAPAAAASDAGVTRQAQTAQAQARARAERNAPREPARTLTRPAAPVHP